MLLARNRQVLRQPLDLNLGMRSASHLCLSLSFPLKVVDFFSFFVGDGNGHPCFTRVGAQALLASCCPFVKKHGPFLAKGISRAEAARGNRESRGSRRKSLNVCQGVPVIGVLFGCVDKNKKWPWYTWWFNHLPGPSISPKRTPMVPVVLVAHVSHLLKTRGLMIQLVRDSPSQKQLRISAFVFPYWVNDLNIAF